MVVSLLSRLPGAIYYVFLNNLFLLPHLFQALRQQGIAATGTARVNYGIYAPFVVAKQEDCTRKSWAFNTVKAMPTPEGQGMNSSAGFAGGPQQQHNHALSAANSGLTQ
ncbi:hypothetical protein S40293_10151 [Stachybotrys chartarum IBT 40293]|nr:hypothetical protein S40293_10151 [Stachybotrys chartarum IBT 40293]